MTKYGLSASNISSSHPRPPAISLPPRSGPDGFSPGPLTLMSSLFSPDAAASRSFSQLLAGAMASPAATEGSKYKQNRPVNLVVSETESEPPVFMIPPGLSPSVFLSSPGIFSPARSPFGMSHQQALAQVTAQAALAQSNVHIQSKDSQTSSVNPIESYEAAPLSLELVVSSGGPSEISQSGANSQTSAVATDKPAEDGYNWRKYGQKQVKGSQYPRSYYKCTYFHCPVKKKVERSPQGQIIEIIYKGQHNHEQSAPKRFAKDKNTPIETGRSQVNPAFNQISMVEAPKHVVEAAPDQLVQKKGRDSEETCLDSQPIKAGELANGETKGSLDSDDRPIQKRRNTGSMAAEPTLTQNTVVEPKIIVQTRSEVDLLDDGFRWRKYGQKVVKGNSNPRSYYKCTTPGCNVRKHVERASTDPKAVITTYEGKHSHDIPVGRGNSCNISNGLPNLKSRMAVAGNHTVPNDN